MAKTFTDYTPKEIVAELDKYIIGQESAKKSVAVALRNRYRRNQLSEEMREEISPKNILMMGPTGVGKTEIARRLAKLMDAPFVKVEATKFTEVGYVGRDVDSMVRDLMEASLRVTKQKRMAEKYEAAAQLAEEKIIEAIIPGKKKQSGETVRGPFDFLMGRGTATYNQTSEKIEEHKEPVESETELAREQVRQQLREGLLEEQYIEIDVQEQPKDNNLDVAQGGMISLGSIFGDAMPKRTKKKNVKVKDARKILTEQEAQNMIDMDQVTQEALDNCEQNGIIFIDEIDKIAGSGYKGGADVSREGVQRDILPIVEGSVVNTKYGPVKTDHILFIGAGAFHVSRPTDLIPELQGRFPIRVELENLTKEDFVRILTEPDNALLKQHKALLETEGASIEFTPEAVDEIASMAFMVNEQTENIGARRLHTIMEKLLEDISYNLPDENTKTISITPEYVREKFEEQIHEDDIDRFIL
ncbi:MAG: ATP-dependent protease ATPase subunit HslU [Firmicutes bacterium]|nr:ATP-dependent protease ATPase subunit HslU [Bacillota bacterium]MBQ6295809.1 ATP-dependent protease ATPase subunit HslU [Bacillota bacterium]MBR6970592.1 ATP-dependent protease ATPase subunit HslU [Bacillota bacterium]